VVALAVVVVNWIAARPDSLAGLQLFSGLADGPVPAEVAFLLSFVLLGIIPAIAARPLLGAKPWKLGLGLGDTKAGLIWVAIGIPVAIAAAVVGAGSPAIASEYPLGNGLSRSAMVFLPYVFCYGIYYLAFEYLYRGYLLLGMAYSLGGARANLLQAALATAAHIGKPPAELISAFPASLAFGWLALRTNSIWYALAVHWIVGVCLDWLLLGR
jgi:membrane protease YdiL (CAAX protease family)